MKLRNKLVAVLAASMVVTSVPVVTMADTTNYVSTSRYAQKGTTYGYLEDTAEGYTVIYGQKVGIGDSVAAGGFDYNFSNGFEFVPVNTYNQTDATYFDLTKDSDFNTKAMLTYVDAFNSATGVSHLAFDGDKVVNANNPYYNGKTADDLLKEGIKMYYVVNYGTKVAEPAFNATLLAPTVATKVNDVFDAKVKAAGSSLYTADISFDDLMNNIKAQIVAYINASVGTYPKVDSNGKPVLDSNGNPIVIDNRGKTIKVDEIVKAADAMIKAEKANLGIKEDGKIVTTTYTELYKSSGELVESKLAQIIKETIVEVGNATTAANYETASKGAYTAAITIQKVDTLDVKDANDREYKSHIRVTSNDQFVKGVTYKIPILAKLGGDKQVLLQVRGNDSNITNGIYALTQSELTGKRLTVEAGSEKIRVNETDQIGEIKFTESQIKALANGKNRRIKIELPRTSDLEFNLSKTVNEMKLTGMRGLYATDADGDGKADSVATATQDPTVRTAKSGNRDKMRVYFGETSRRTYAEDDRQTLIIELPDWATKTSIGELSLKGIFVQPVDDKANVGEVNATISEYYNASAPYNEKAEDLIDTKTIKVAEVKEYDITLTCDKPASIKAGRSGLVNDNKTTFVLEEVVKDSLVDGRKIKFTVENGYIFGPADIQDNVNAATANSGALGLYGTASYKELARTKFMELLDQEKIKFEEKANNTDNDGINRSSIVLDIDAEGRVVGFSATYPKLKSDSADKIKVTMPIAADVMAKGEVKVKAENLYTRSFQDKKEDPSCVIANVIEPIAVTFDGAKLKVGKQAQEAGTITIKETDKAMLQKGWLYFNADNQNGITFDAVPTVTVEGADSAKALVVKNVALSKDKTMVGIEITRESTEASTIKISGINMTADRTVPEANYDLAIWGDALTDENELGIANFTQNALYNHRYFNQTSDLYLVKDFVQMTTVNTEDLIGAAKAVTTQFVIGEKKFTVNGESVTMDAAPYIKDNLTFIPVKYLAQAFGIQGSGVQYDKATSTVTIIAGDKVIKMTNGKAVMTVNGTEVPMASKATIGKDGRMYVPMAYIASALGVEKKWEPTTKTATFTNQK